jgi:hypothetical protein
VATYVLINGGYKMTHWNIKYTKPLPFEGGHGETVMHAVRGKWVRGAKTYETWYCINQWFINKRTLCWWTLEWGVRSVRVIERHILRGGRGDWRFREERGDIWLHCRLLHVLMHLLVWCHHSLHFHLPAIHPRPFPYFHRRGQHDFRKKFCNSIEALALMFPRHLSFLGSHWLKQARRIGLVAHYVMRYTSATAHKRGKCSDLHES